MPHKDVQKLKDEGLNWDSYGGSEPHRKKVTLEESLRSEGQDHVPQNARTGQVHLRCPEGPPLRSAPSTELSREIGGDPPTSRRRVDTVHLLFLHSSSEGEESWAFLFAASFFPTHLQCSDWTLAWELGRKRKTEE